MWRCVQTAYEICKVLEVDSVHIDYLLCEAQSKRFYPKGDPLPDLSMTKLAKKMADQRQSQMFYDSTAALETSMDSS